MVAASQPRIYSPLVSPDGKWRAEVITYDCVSVNRIDQNAYEELRLVEISTGVETVIETQLQNCGGLGAVGLANLLWSSTSRYLYYTQARDGYPDGCGYWERPITRFDMASQSIQQLGGGPLSPDKTKIATWQWPKKELIIWAVDGDEFARVPAHMPDASTGPMAWSPDGRSLVYLQAELDCYAFGNTYLIHLDISTLEQELLLQSRKPSWGNVIWESTNQLKLFDENRKEWRYNLSTGKLEMRP